MKCLFIRVCKKSDFKMYIRYFYWVIMLILFQWCNKDPRCKKLQLTDLLVSPVHHIMKVGVINIVENLKFIYWQIYIFMSLSHSFREIVVVSNSWLDINWRIFLGNPYEYLLWVLFVFKNDRKSDRCSFRFLFFSKNDHFVKV